MLRVKRDQIRAIGEITSTVTEVLHHDAQVADLIAPLQRLTGCDAIMLASRNPFGDVHRPICHDGYSPPLLAFLHRQYLSCPSYSRAAGNLLPMRMRDFGSTFYQTQVYEKFLHPAGYREGVTLVLRGAGEQVSGLLTMNFEHAQQADDHVRDGLDMVAGALGRLCDLSTEPRWLARRLDAAAAAFLVDASGATLRVRPHSGYFSVVSAPQPEAIAAARALLDGGAGHGRELRGYVQARDAWHRLHVVITTAGGQRAALLLVQPDSLPFGLTRRELDVLTLIAMGMTNKDIGHRLDVSARTVGAHVAHVIDKTGLDNRTSLAACAVRDGLLRIGLLL